MMFTVAKFAALSARLSVEPRAYGHGLAEGRRLTRHHLCRRTPCITRNTLPGRRRMFFLYFPDGA